jgi:beta-galactosidase
MLPETRSEREKMNKQLCKIRLWGFALTVLFTLFLNACAVVTTTQAPLDETDIYNGLRGQSFNEVWKFCKGEVTDGQDTALDDSHWENVTLPHDWSIFNTPSRDSAAGAGGGCMDGGVGWYRKTFTISAEDKARKVFIGFDGIYMNSQVWINGKSLGTRPYGYTSFEYDLTPHLIYGKSNVIAVRVNNNQPNSRWYSGSGIYRNVWLTVLNPTHVDYCGMFVTTPSVSSSQAAVNIKTKIMNQSGQAQSVTLTTAILDANGKAVATHTSSSVNIAEGGNNTFNQDIAVSSPQLWSLSLPYLYIAQTQVNIDGRVADTYQTTLGIRSFAFDSNTGFSLNGVNMKINGVCNHHDLGALGAAVNYRAIVRQLEILKAMGCNAIRTSHNPPDPRLLEACDRMGFLVKDEAFDVWEVGKNNLNDYHLYFNEWAQADIQAMVLRDRNHPSVIMWSIGNEIQGPSVATATKLRDWVKAIDTTRPVTWASNNMGSQVEQDIAAILDLAGYNYHPRFYDEQHKKYPHWKMFASETVSAVSSRGVYKALVDGKGLPDSSNQCSSYDNDPRNGVSNARQSYTHINSRKFMAGEFVWTGFDYIGEPYPYEGAAKSSYFGIIDTCGFPKDSYYFYQSKWTTAPMVHVLPHWNWPVGTKVSVWVYSNCDTVELFLNDVSQGVKTVGDSLNLSWDVPWEPGTIRAKGVKGNTVVYDQQTTAGAPAKVKLKPDRTRIMADGKDLVFIETDITDAQGVLVPNTANKVNFSVSGPGKIVGVDNGNPISYEPYKSSSRQAFSGKCLVIVQTTKTGGSIVVTAGSDGLSSDSVTISSTGGYPIPTSISATR